MHSDSAAPSVTNRPRMLIVEDDPQIMFALREFFCREGFSVDCAVGASESRRMLDEFGYSVLLTDLHLSRFKAGEGLKVLQHARTRHPAIRAIMMTAFTSMQLDYDARRLGADEVLEKPIDLADLIRIISTSGSGTGSACA